jgi:hypothetical protein
MIYTGMNTTPTDEANKYEVFEAAEMMATDDSVADLVALSRASKAIRALCHDAIRAHLARSEAQIVRDDYQGYIGWVNERGVTHRYCDRPASFGQMVCMWVRNGIEHRDTIDPTTGLHLPAAIYTNGIREWYVNGQLHRDDIDPNGPPGYPRHLPAILGPGGAEWAVNGRLYRDDIDPETGQHLPAHSFPASSFEWSYNMRPHCKGISAPLARLSLLIYLDTSRSWRCDGKEGRDEIDPKSHRHLPSLIHPNGTRQWMRENQLHRDDRDENGKLLPATIRADGSCDWYIDGIRQWHH